MSDKNTHTACNTEKIVKMSDDPLWWMGKMANQSTHGCTTSTNYPAQQWNYSQELKKNKSSLTTWGTQINKYFLAKNALDPAVDSECSQNHTKNHTLYVRQFQKCPTVYIFLISSLDVASQSHSMCYLFYNQTSPVDIGRKTSDTSVKKSPHLQK